MTRTISSTIALSLLFCSNASALSSSIDYLSSLQPTSSVGFRPPTSHENLENVVERTPEDHYAKEHPGAGWAGFKHPMYGGYLDHLSSSSAGTATLPVEAKRPAAAHEISGSSQPSHGNLHLELSASQSSAIINDGHCGDNHQNSPPSSYLDSLHGNLWEEGKPAEYGDDVRWGAQVYLDAL